MMEEMNCGYIVQKGKRSAACGRIARQQYRVLGVAPYNPKLRVFMLVPLCKRHGRIKGPRR